MENRRLISYNLLNNVLNQKKSLFEEFNNIVKHMEKKEIGFIKELVFGTIRYKKLIDYLFTEATDKNMSNISAKSKNIIRSAIYQIYFMKKKEYAVVDESVKLAKNITKKDDKFINWCLREFLRKKDSIKIPSQKNKNDFAIKYSFPVHFIEYLIKENGVNYTEQLLNFYNSKSDIHAFNIKNGEVNKIDDISIMNNEEYIISPTFVNMFRFIENLEVKTVLDCCAAPGGKTFLTKYFIPDSEILSIDKSEERLILLKKNIDKFKLKNIKIMNIDFLESNINKVFDFIILDVPCSSSGTIRKNPDVKYNYRKKMNSLTELQSKMIEKASDYVKNNGYIFYTTCSIFEEENYKIIKNFLNKNKDFSLYNQFFTFGNPHSGGYGALLKKTGG